MEERRIGNIYGFDGGNFAGNVYDDKATSPTIRTYQGGNQQPCIITNCDYRIRKITPRECGRLMSVSDSDISKMENVNSNTQMYKQFGNSIVVQVMVAMFSNLNIQGLPDWDEIKEKY
jgi:cytosine-specific methyltransferase